MNTISKIAIGVGVTAGAVLLASCASTKTPEDKALDDFRRFDTNPQDNAWTPNEVAYERTTTPSWGMRYNEYRDGDYVHYTQDYSYDVVRGNMNRAFQAARGSDNVATLSEMAALIARFDTNDEPGLQGDEQRAFNKMYGPSLERKEIVLARNHDYYYSPISHGGTGGSTGPGDDYGNGGTGGTGGSTGPGDDYGSGTTPSGPGGQGGDTGPGDE